MNNSQISMIPKYYFAMRKAGYKPVAAMEAAIDAIMLITGLFTGLVEVAQADSITIDDIHFSPVWS